MTDTIKTAGNENEFLEMSNHYKEVLEKRELLINTFKKKYMNEKKVIARIYGLMAELIDYMEDTSPLDNNDIIIEYLTHSIHGICCDNLFKQEIIELDLN